MRRLEGLDGLRGGLAVYVMASHVGPFLAVAPGWHWLPTFVSHGQAAVDVFFILSGLVIVPSVQAFGGRAAPFLVARAGRIYPVFLVCLAAALAVAALPPGFDRMPWLAARAPDIWPHAPADAWWARLAAHLTLTHGLFPQAVLPDVWTSVLGSAWSLSTEAQFYVVVAALCGLASGRSGGFMRPLAVGLLAAAGLGAAWQAVAPAPFQFSRAFLPLAGQYFALGVASVGVVRGQPGALPFAALSLAACLLICLPGGADKALPPLFWAICLAAELGRGGVVLRPVQVLLRARPVRWLGAISYCLYLVHEPVQKLAGLGATALAGGDGAVFNAVFVPLAVALPLVAAAALHRLVELPGIARSRALADRLASGAAEPAIQGAAPVTGAG